MHRVLPCIVFRKRKREEKKRYLHRHARSISGRKLQKLAIVVASRKGIWWLEVVGREP